MGKSMDLDSLNLKFTASAGNVGQTFSALEKRLKNLSTVMSSVDTSGLEKMTNGFMKLNTAVSSFSGNDGMNKAIRSLATSLNKMQTVDTASVARVQSVLTSLGNSMRTFPVIDISKSESLKNLATTISSFSKIKSVNGITGLSELGKNLQTLMSEMDRFDASQFAAVAQAIKELAEALNILGRSKAEKAISNLPQLSKGIKQLMKSLARAPTISKELIQMTTALAQLSANGAKVGTAAAGLNKALGNTQTAGSRGATGIKLFSNAAKTSQKHIKSLASVVGGLIAKYWILVRAVQGVGKLMGLASSLTEVDNVVAHAFGQATDKVNEFSKNAIEAFGMSELSAKQYASRFQAMATAMEIPDSAANKANQFLGVKLSGVLQDNSDAYRNLGESMADVSINLTKLTADYASFFDVAQEEVAEKMTSIFTGQTRPLREYGLDLTEATLKEWALKNGLDANISAMTQAEKAMLRYQYVMANSAIVMGDFTRTSDTFHNSVVRLKENAKALGITIGESLIQIFKPVIQWANAAIVALNNFAKTVSNALGKILGWKKEWVEGGTTNTGYAEEITDIGDSAGGAAKKVKELNKQLQGFDELNNLTTNDDNNGGGGSGGAGSVGAGGGSANSGYWKDLEEGYESIYDTPFKLGAYISQSITDSLNGINWEDIKANVSGFSKSCAEFFNGLITPEMFGVLGKTISEGLNTAFLAIGTFAQTADWNGYGQSLATGLTTMFTTFDGVEAGKAMHNFMGGVLDALIIAIDQTNWSEFGKKLGDYIANLDIPDLLSKFATLAGKIASALLDALISFAQNTSWQDKMGLAILALVKVAKITGLGSILSTLISGAMPTSLGLGGKPIALNGITLALGGITWAIGSRIGTSLGQVIALWMGDDDLADAYAAWADLTFPEKLLEIKTALEFTWEEIKANFNKETPEASNALRESGFSTNYNAGKKFVEKWKSGNLEEELKEKIQNGTAFDLWGAQGSTTHLNANGVIHGGSSGSFNVIQKGFNPTNSEVRNQSLVNPTLDSGSWAPLKNFLANIKEMTISQSKLTGGTIDQELGGSGTGKGEGALRNGIHIGKLEIPGAKEADQTVIKLNKDLAKLNTEGSKSTKTFSTNASKSFNTTNTAETKLNKETKTFTTNTPSWFKNMSTKVGTYTSNTKQSIVNNLSTANSTGSKQMSTLATNSSKSFSTMSTDAGTYTGDNTKGILGKVKDAFGKIFSNIDTGTKNIEPTVSQRFKAAATAVGTNTGDSSVGMLGILRANLGSMNSETQAKFGAMATSVSTNTGSGASGMLGVLKSNLLQMKDETENKFGIMKTTVENTKADAKFGVSVPSVDEVDKNMFAPLKSVWKNLTAKATIEAPTDNKTALQNAYERRKSIWQPLKALAEIVAPTQNKRELENAYSGRKGIWKDYTADFNVSTEGSGEKLQSDWNYLTGNVWKDYNANFGVSVSASADSADVARSALYKLSEAMENTQNAVLRNAATQLRVQANYLHAKGGVFDEATFGIFGEDGAEAIVPLEKNIGWAKNVADLITARMPLTAVAPPQSVGSFSAPAYTPANSGTANGIDNNALAKQNELLQEEIELLKQIAAKDVSISSSDVFNAVRSESRNYSNRTGNSPFIS